MCVKPQDLPGSCRAMPKQYVVATDLDYMIHLRTWFLHHAVPPGGSLAGLLYQACHHAASNIIRCKT
jgi:hypothetical protein